ncbi:MAG: hypothetical protein LWY06_06560 [Firmicutes bacterium]|nr:hypothetical protein [Bacillota bacterium]
MLSNRTRYIFLVLILFSLFLALAIPGRRSILKQHERVRLENCYYPLLYQIFIYNSKYNTFPDCLEDLTKKRLIKSLPDGEHIEDFKLDYKRTINGFALTCSGKYMKFEHDNCLNEMYIMLAKNKQITDSIQYIVIRPYNENEWYISFLLKNGLKKDSIINECEKYKLEVKKNTGFTIHFEIL